MEFSARRRVVAVLLVVATVGLIGCGYWVMDGRGTFAADVAAIVGLLACAVALVLLGIQLGRLERDEYRD